MQISNKEHLSKIRLKNLWKMLAFALRLYAPFNLA